MDDLWDNTICNSKIMVEIMVLCGDGDLDIKINSLTKYHTVGELKDEIYQILNIPPSDQIITGWLKHPTGDDNILDSCGVSTSNTNYLIVNNRCNTEYHKTDDLKMDVDVTETVSGKDDGGVKENNTQGDGNFSRTDRSPKNEEWLREEALLTEASIISFESAVSFIEKYSSCSGDVSVTLHTGSLHDAITEASLAPLERRKVLLLYLHVDKDRFSETFWKILKNKEACDIIERNFYLIGWDIQDQYQSALIKALESFTKLADVSNLVKNKVAAALFIVPIKDTFTIFSCARGRVTERDFISLLKNAEEYLLTENDQEDQLRKLMEETGRSNDIGSKEYQQIMFDMLGNRDYDSFNPSEHEYLKNKIGYALYGPPKEETGYTDVQNRDTEMLYKVIIRESCEEEKGSIVMKVIYNCVEPLPKVKVQRAKKFEDYNPYTDIQPVPIFVLRKCHSNVHCCRIFIDHAGRVYDSWMHYLKQNKLEQCEMILPKNGIYLSDDKGEVILEKHLSPACDIDSKILEVTDVSTGILGLTTTGIVLASLIPTVAVAPVALVVAGSVGIGVGVYSVARSAFALYDIKKHKQSMSFANSEARGAYINILAGSLGFVGAGANVAVTQLAARGFEIGKGAGAVVTALGIVNIGASGAGIVNSSYDIIHNWIAENKRPSALALLQLSSSILFFGHAVYNFKPGSVLVEEAQSNVLQEFQESLRSNRHRKTFNRLLKETIKNCNGNVSEGQAQVITAIRSIQSRDEVFALLTRNTKNYSQKGIRFAVSDGEIKLNGYSIDVNELIAINKMDVNSLTNKSSAICKSDVDFLINLPKARIPTDAETFSLRSIIERTFSLGTLDAAKCLEFLLKIIGFCQMSTMEEIISAVSRLIDEVLKDNLNIVREITEFMPRCSSPLFPLFEVVISFFKEQALKLEEQREDWLRTKDPKYDSVVFHLPGMSESGSSERFVRIFNHIVQKSFCGPNISRVILQDLLKFFYTWLAEKKYLYETVSDSEVNENVNENSSMEKRTKTDCDICKGYYFK